MNQLEFTQTVQGLTPKPRMVLTLLLAGKTDEEVAAAIKATPATVRKHIQNLCDRFGIEREVEGYKRNRREDLINLASQYLAGNPVKAVERIRAPLKTRQDWGEAIDVGAFYGREEELAELEHWIVKDRCRLVAILGMGGIGKTALSLKLAERVSREFEVVIWRSLRHAPSIQDLLADLIQSLSGGQETALPQTLEERILRLIHYLRASRCLLLLDNAESILREGDFAGNYRDGYEGYNELLERVGLGSMGEEPHRSCLILTSREKPKNITALEGKNLPVRSLQLSGLKNEEAKEILSAKNLSGAEDDYRKLVNRYIGNPLALKIVSTTIQELFGGDIANFLAQSTIVFGGIRNLLNEQFERLSVLEEKVMYWLAINRDWVSLSDLWGDIVPPIPQMELLEALESLVRRSLIETSSASFVLQPVVMEHTTDRLVERTCEEIATGKIALLKSHALVKAQAKDYIREIQIHCILEPIIKRLITIMGSKHEIEAQLAQILATVRGESPLETGYVGGNVLNMLRELHIDLSNYDFSDLTIWQAYLQGVNLRNVSFAHSNLAKSVFMETFGNVLSVAFSPDGQVLATGDADGEIHSWQFSDVDNEQLLTYRGHTGWVRSVAFSPDGQTLASSGDDQTVRIWDTRSGQCLKFLQGHTSWIRSVAFSPDGSLLASGCDDRVVRIHDVRLGECIQALKGHTGEVQSVAFSPDRQCLASGSDDQSIRLWDVNTGECLHTLQGHTGRVSSVAFSPDNCLLASGSDDQTIKLWEVNTGQCLQTLKGHTGRVRSVAFAPQRSANSPDGQMLASGSEDQTVKLWEVSTSECRHTLEGHTSRIWSVAFSPDGQTLASGSEDQMVKLWNPYKGRCRQTLKGYTRSVRSIAFAPQCDANRLEHQILASGGEDRIVRLWEIHTEQRRHLRGHIGRIWSVSFSPDGRILASSSDDRTIKLWDVNTGYCRQTLQGHANWVRFVTFSPNGQMLASGSDDCTVKLWDVGTGQCLRTLPGHTDWIWAIAFSPDGQVVASGGGDRTVKLWDINTGECFKTLKGHTKPLRTVAFSPDSRLLASAGEDQTIRLWDPQSSQCLKLLTGHVGSIRSVAFSPDGQILASGGDDQTVRLWDLDTGKLFHTLQGHTDRIRSLAFSLDGRMLASGSKDETIKLWDLVQGECLKTLRSNRPYENMNITEITGVNDATIATLKALGAVEN